MSGNRGIVWYQKFLEILTTGDAKNFKIELQKIIVEMASYHYINSLTPEIFYQRLMLGILAGVKDTHDVRSNRESGDGRYDLAIIPNKPKELGIIMKFKAVENKNI